MTEDMREAVPLSDLTYEEIKALVDSGWPWPLSAVQEWFEDWYNDLRDWIYEYAKDAINWVFRTAGAVWTTLKNKVTDAIEDFFDWATWFWNKLVDYVKKAVEATFKAFTWFWNEIEDWFDWLWDKVKARITWAIGEVDDIIDWLWTEIVKKFTWLGTKFGELGSWLWALIEPQISSILLAFGPLGTAIGLIVPDIRGKMLEDWQAAFDWLTPKFLGIEAFFKEHVEDPLSDFVDEWISNVTGFFGGLWNTIWTTLQTFWNVVTEFFTEDLVPGIVAGFRWLSDWFGEAIDSIMDSLFGWLRAHSPMTPEDAPSSAVGLLTILGISAAGLGLMTAAGELMHPLATWQLGHVSAMIGDVVNYRAISGVIMGAVIGGAIRTPLTYYVNDMLRPWLPDKAQVMELRSRQLIPYDQFTKLQGYYGYADKWMKYLDSMTETGVGYFALRGISDSGYYDKALFERDLRRRGHAQEMIDALLPAYEAAALGEAKGMFSSYAITGFKEGHYEERDLREILAALGYKEPGLSRMVFAAYLAYEIDYRSDMLSGYRDAFRKDQITEVEFRKALAELPIVPERIDGYVFVDTVKKIGKIKA